MSGPRERSRGSSPDKRTDRTLSEQPNGPSERNRTMTTETTTRTYPYGLFPKIAPAANAEHIGTAKKVHHWTGPNHELRYFAKLRAFEVAHLGESRFLYVD